MKTIIQTIGPLYGDVVNGSVFGQPNGSIARPVPNSTPSITIAGDSGKLTLASSTVAFAKYDLSGVTFTFVNSDLIANNNVIIRNASEQTVARGVYPFDSKLAGAAANTPADGDALTIIVELYDSYGVVIGTSNVLTISAVIP